MRDMAFGQYYPTNSPIHKLDPRAKLIFSLLFMIFIFFAKSYTAFFYVIIFLSAVTIIAKIPLKIVLGINLSAMLIVIAMSCTGTLMYFKGLSKLSIASVSSIGVVVRASILVPMISKDKRSANLIVKMKKLTFTYRDLVAFFVISVLIVLIMLDCYLTKSPAESIFFASCFLSSNDFVSFFH